MLSDARDGKFKIIVAYSLSRLFRNALDYMKARAELRSAGVKLISVTQDFADSIGADGYAPDASSAANTAKSLLGV